MQRRRFWKVLAVSLAIGCSDATAIQSVSLEGSWRFTQPLDASVNRTVDLLLEQRGDSVIGLAYDSPGPGTALVYGRVVGDSVALTLEAVYAPPPCPGGMHVYARLSSSSLRGSYVVCDAPTPAVFDRRDVQDAAINGVWKLVLLDNENPGPQASHGVLADTLELRADGRARASVHATSYSLITSGTYESTGDSIRVHLFQLSGFDIPLGSRYSLQRVGDSLVREVKLSAGGVRRWVYRR